MKILLSFCFQLIVGLTFAQHKQPNCPIELDARFELTIEIVVNKENLQNTTSSYISYLPDSTNLNLGIDPNTNEKCSSYAVLFDETESNWCVLIPHDKSVSRLKMPKESIESVVFIIETLRDSVGEVFDCSDIRDLTHLKDFASLKSVKIISPYYIGPPDAFQINLSQWPIYKELIEFNNLIDFEVNLGYNTYRDSNLLSDLQSIKSLETIRVQELSSPILSKFDNLKELQTEGIHYFFTQDILNINQLKSFTDYNDQYYLYNDPYAAIVFFNAQKQITDKNNRLYFEDSLLKAYLRKNLLVNGNYVITYGDLAKYSLLSINPVTWSADTFAWGKIEQNTPIDYWYFNNKLAPRKPRYFYNYSNLESTINFPTDGDWTYEYPNGVLAIAGSFKEGKKEGVWKFYYPNGKLNSIKTFHRDLPEGIFVDNYDRRFCEWSEYKEGCSYYINLRESYQVNSNTLFHIKGGVLIESMSATKKQMNIKSEYRDSLLEQLQIQSNSNK